MRNVLFFRLTRLVLPLALFAAAAPFAFADERLAEPEISVNTGVLTEYQPGNPFSETSTTLSRPVEKAFKPTLTTPEREKKPVPKAVEKKPEQAAAVKNKPAVTPPKKTPTPQKQAKLPLPPTKPPRLPIAKKDEFLSAPDPAKDILRSVQVKEPPAPAKNKTAEARPLPKAAAKAPVPPKRSAVQTASKAFVDKARQQQKEQNPKISERPVATIMSVLPAGSRKQDGPRVPAMPAGRVMAEPLRPLPGLIDGGLNSKLDEDDLHVPDKEELAAAIEAIARQKKMKGAKKVSKPVEIQDISLPDIEPASGKTDAETATMDITEASPLTPMPSESNSVLGDGNIISLGMKAGEDSIGETEKSALANTILPRMKKNPEERLQVQSFATAIKDKDVSARKISLSRAMAVRDWLLQNGIESGRIDIRAMGNQTDEQPLDRIDLILKEGTS